MEKALNPIDGSVHLLDKRRKGPYGLFYLCVCGKESGLFWKGVPKDTPLGCLVCLMYEEGKKKNKPLNNRRTI